MTGRRIKAKRKCLAGSLLAVLLLLGCVRQSAWLTYSIPATSEPSPTAIHTPAATMASIPIAVEPIQGESFYTDRKGIPILDQDSHYFTYYLAFSDLRIYEEGGYTYMDGICTNSFDGTLKGEARICFYDKDEKLVGYGDIHKAEGGLTLSVGQNRIYAEILSEGDVQQLSCRIEQIAPFNPA